MAPINQALIAAKGLEPYSPAQAAWLRYVDKVERGEAVDPSGQYVAKATKGATDAAGHRSSRPKFDAATPTFAQHYRLQQSGEVVGQPATNNPEEDGPPFICDGCEGPGQGIPVPYTPSFTSSVNRGGSGQIHDLKLVGSGSSTSRGRALNNGYVLLEADLNKGAGGAYVYLCFIRDAANVLNALEYYQGQPDSGPMDVLTAFATQNGSTSDKPAAAPRYFDIWSPNQNAYYFWGYLDLNAGAGGEYIYSYQSKSNQVANFNGYISEVGILSGNSASIMPPAGWIKYPQDLNEGAGGDFIYFCYKY